MLLNNFYTLVKHEAGADSVKATIAFQRSHKIFEGHFPGHPVVPGVCMMQIVREVLEKSLSAKLNIVQGDNLKFLSIINPELNKTVEVSINYTVTENNYSVNASLHAEQTTFFKFKGILQKV